MPKGGLKDLKKNEFIKSLSDLKHNVDICGSCSKNQAITFCIDCSFNYCSTCLEVHKKNPATRNHQLRNKSKDLSKEKANAETYSICTEHFIIERLLCEDCKIVLCDHCSSLKHKNHKIELVSEQLISVKTALKHSLKEKTETLKNVCLNLESVEDNMSDNRLKAANLKEEIQQREEDLKKAIELIMVELNKNVDKELKRCQTESTEKIKKLKQLESTLTAEIDALNEQLNNLNYKNMLEASNIHPMKKDSEIIPKYFGQFDISLYFDDDDENMASLKSIYGNVGRVPKVHLVKEDKIGIDDDICSFDVSRDDLFLCYRHKDHYEVMKVINYSELKDMSSQLVRRNVVYKLYDLDDFISAVDDILIIDEMLIVGGKNDDDECSYVLKINMEKKKWKPTQIYKSPIKDKKHCIRLSKSSWENILVILADKLIELSLDGAVALTIDLRSEIYHGLPNGIRSYVVSGDEEMFFIDVKGCKIRNASCGECRALMAPVHFVKDKRGDIYAIDFIGKKLFVLDNCLNVKVSLETKNHLDKVCYDDKRDVLLALDGRGLLSTFEL